MELQCLLEKLIRREDLSELEARFAIEQIASDVSSSNPVPVGVLLALLAAKGETPCEVAAFATYMREQSISVVVKVRMDKHKKK